MDGNAMAIAMGKLTLSDRRNLIEPVTVLSEREHRDTPVAASCERPMSGCVIPGMMN